jgi:predicted RNase H-like HicB family nuclease
MAKENSTGYIALIHKDKDTSYGVSFPDVPGCISAGDTFEDAITNASEAPAGHFAVMCADGEKISQPRSIESLRENLEFAEDAADAVIAFVMPRSEQVSAA